MMMTLDRSCHPTTMCAKVMLFCNNITVNWCQTSAAIAAAEMIEQRAKAMKDKIAGIVCHITSHHITPHHITPHHIT